ncbi:GNAT family N-acetyltransferase [Planctomycetota bacterium]
MPIVIGDKSRWGQGIGKRVVGALLGRARDHGYSKITLKESTTSTSARCGFFGRAASKRSAAVTVA